MTFLFFISVNLSAMALNNNEIEELLQGDLSDIEYFGEIDEVDEIDLIEEQIADMINCCEHNNAHIDNLVKNVIIFFIF